MESEIPTFIIDELAGFKGEVPLSPSPSIAPLPSKNRVTAAHILRFERASESFAGEKLAKSINSFLVAYKNILDTTITKSKIAENEALIQKQSDEEDDEEEINVKEEENEIKKSKNSLFDKIKNILRIIKETFKQVIEKIKNYIRRAFSRGENKISRYRKKSFWKKLRRQLLGRLRQLGRIFSKTLRTAARLAWKNIKILMTILRRTLVWVFKMLRYLIPANTRRGVRQRASSITDGFKNFWDGFSNWVRAKKLKMEAPRYRVGANGRIELDASYRQKAERRERAYRRLNQSRRNRRFRFFKKGKLVFHKLIRKLLNKFRRIALVISKKILMPIFKKLFKKVVKAVLKWAAAMAATAANVLPVIGQAISIAMWASFAYDVYDMVQTFSDLPNQLRRASDYANSQLQALTNLKDANDVQMDDPRTITQIRKAIDEHYGALESANGDVSNFTPEQINQHEHNLNTYIQRLKIQYKDNPELLVILDAEQIRIENLSSPAQIASYSLSEIDRHIAHFEEQQRKANENLIFSGDDALKFKTIMGDDVFWSFFFERYFEYITRKVSEIASNEYYETIKNQVLAGDFSGIRTFSMVAPGVNIENKELTVEELANKDDATIGEMIGAIQRDSYDFKKSSHKIRYNGVIEKNNQIKKYNCLLDILQSIGGDMRGKEKLKPLEL